MSLVQRAILPGQAATRAGCSFIVRCALTVLITCFMAPVVVAQETNHADTHARVADLIEQLGAPKYVLRQAARQALRDEGLSAFDQLLEATSYSDPEIAAAAQRLLETMTVRWTRGGDLQEVRLQLQDFGTKTVAKRRLAIRSLADLDDQQGVAALCRVARFDVSEQVAREAALLAMPVSTLVVPSEQYAAVAVAESRLTAEYGLSSRPTGEWLRLFAMQASDPKGALKPWREAIADEQELVASRRPFTSERFIANLRWNWLRVQLAAQEHEHLLETVDALAIPNMPGSEAALIRALEWMVEAGADKSVDQLIASRREQLTTKRGLYLAAMIRDKQGRLDESAELANQAFAAAPDPADEVHLENRKALDGRVMAAMRVEAQGYSDWARREYRAAAEQTAALSINAAYARWQLADLQLDHEEYAQAADELAISTDAIDRDRQSRSLYSHYREEFNRVTRRELPSLTDMAARRDYCRALAARAEGDREAEIAALESAIKLTPGDADILIAMYRVQGADETFRRETIRRIHVLADEKQREIIDNPNEPDAYNQWAWLISNTEGDFSKAVRYSQKSMEVLGQEVGGYLDTLGRCYYALGDLERAVEVQRRAVEMQPHMQVIKRQLVMFEEALAKSRSDEKSEPANSAL